MHLRIFTLVGLSLAVFHGGRAELISYVGTNAPRPGLEFKQDQRTESEYEKDLATEYDRHARVSEKAAEEEHRKTAE